VSVHVLEESFAAGGGMRRFRDGPPRPALIGGAGQPLRSPEMIESHDAWRRTRHTVSSSDTVKPESHMWLAYTSGGVNCETG
jgi:hypothetical protein